MRPPESGVGDTNANCPPPRFRLKYSPKCVILGEKINFFCEGVKLKLLCLKKFDEAKLVHHMQSKQSWDGQSMGCCEEACKVTL